MGAFDDLIPSGPSNQTFADLIAQGNSRATRLRKIAAAAVPPAGAGDLYKDSFTLGLQKPIAGLANVVGGKINEWTGTGPYANEPASVGELYRAGTGGYDDRMQKARDDTGWGGTAASIAGALTPGAPGAALERGVWPLVKAATKVGAVEGAARNSDTPLDAVEGAVKGGATGAGTAFVLGGASQLLPSSRAARAAEREANRGIPTDQLRADARAIYNRLDQSSTAYTPQQATNLADAVRSDLVQNGWDPQGVHSSLNGVLGRLDDLRNGPVTFETLQQIREQLGSNAQSIEPQVRRIAGRAIRNIDGFVANETPAMSNLPPADIGPMAAQARRTWRAANTADDIGWRVDKAERRAASTNSGQNAENAIRQNIRQVIDKAEQPTRYNPYSDAELEQMQRVVEGTPIQNSIRWAGNQLSGIPAQSITGGLGSLGVLGTHGLDPASAALAGTVGLGASAAMTGAGHLVKNQSTRMAQDEADSLMRLITTGSLAPAAPVAGPPTRQALAELIRRQQMMLGAGRAAANATTQP